MTPVTESFERRIERLRRRLSQPLPGPAIYMRMAPENPMHRVVAIAREKGCREGAVLLLLYPLNDTVYTVLTLRAATLRNHAGQISLPGGRIDPGESAVEAATREAWEELGINRDTLEVLGPLSQLYIPPSNFCLTPIIAVAHQRPDFDPHDQEVAELLEAPMHLFTDPSHRREESRLINGQMRRVPYFPVGRHKVWGATAMIMMEMAVVWSEVEGREALGDVETGRSSA